MPRRTLLLLVPLLIAAAPVPIALHPAPGTALDRTARRLSAADLRDAARSGDRPLVLVGSARLGPASEEPILFVQLQSARECGSGGCSTTAFRAVNGAWRRVLDSVSGPITVLPTRHDGFDDLKVGGDRYAWNGTAYVSLEPAPALDLRQQILRHQAAHAAKATSRRARRVPHPTSSPGHKAPAPPA